VPAGRRRRREGGEVRSGENAIIEAGRREGRMRIRAPGRGIVRRQGETGVGSMPSPLTAGEPAF